MSRRQLSLALVAISLFAAMVALLPHVHQLDGALAFSAASDHAKVASSCDWCRVARDLGAAAIEQPAQQPFVAVRSFHTPAATFPLIARTATSFASRAPPVG